jgi:hypothetical protein
LNLFRMFFRYWKDWRAARERLYRHENDPAHHELEVMLERDWSDEEVLAYLKSDRFTRRGGRRDKAEAALLHHGRRELYGRYH